MAFVLDAPAGELTWGAEPRYVIGIAEMLRLNKAPVRWFFRPAAWPVWNDTIREPVRIWSVDGPDEDALSALERRQGDTVRMPAPSPGERAEQATIELEACLAHLREVEEAYWERDWRNEHRDDGIYPEHHLWNAVWGYLDLLRTTDNDPGAAAPRTALHDGSD